MLRNSTLQEKWIVGSSQQHHGRRLKEEYTHDFVEYSPDFAHSSKPIHVLVFLSPYCTLSAAETVEALHTTIHAIADQAHQHGTGKVWNDVAFAYVPYDLKKHRRFLTQFLMVEPGTQSCRESKHSIMVVENSSIKSKKPFSTIPKLRSLLKHILDNL
ncbi:MAG: hypothetical protein ACTSUE_19855 [Promethearchaeota archaeon]